MLVGRAALDQHAPMSSGLQTSASGAFTERPTTHRETKRALSTNYLSTPFSLHTRSLNMNVARLVEAIDGRELAPEKDISQ